jgi:RHS repeat-associated protein
MTWIDSTVEANLKPLSFSSSSALVSLWGRYDTTWNADCGYYVGLRGDGQVFLGKRVVGVDSTIGSPMAVPGGISAGTWYDVKLDIQGTSLKAYVNGTQLLTQTDSSCTSGSVGVGSVGASFEADDVRVTAPATNSCVQDWRTTTCGAFCTYEATVQSDRAGCGAYLDCYATHGCSPETCGGQDDVCGVNVLNPWGTASKEVADQVYKCMGCAGSVDCANPKYYNGTVCADGNPCTWGDTCQNRLCVPDPNRNTQCSASDQCHDVGTCDTGTGICNNPSKLDGTICDDSSACTPTDFCESGVCTGQNPKICPASDQCHQGVCDPATAACSDQPKRDGSSCDDGNACTQTDACLQGTCVGNDPVACPADNCHSPGECDSDTGSCSDPVPVDKIGCNINLRDVDGVVDMGNDNWIALFGWDSTATSQFHPTTNEVSVSVGEVPSTSPNPPAYLIPGKHPGGFLAHFKTGQKITWTVDTQSKDAYADSRSTILTYTPVGTSGGKKVKIPDGTEVTITPDMDEYSKAPDEPTPADEPKLGDPFKGMLTGSLSVGPTGAAIYTVPIVIPPGIAGMAPNLNLVYNSQTGAGIAGQGWDMTGLSVIQRCPKTLVQDGYVKAVAMDLNPLDATNADGLCLDGKRLFLKESTGSSATFEMEYTDFSTITMMFDDKNSNNDVSFTVVTKSGETRYYGSASDSRQPSSRVSLPAEDDNGILSNGQTTIAIWALDRVMDVWGNYYDIQYNDGKSDFSSRGMIVTGIDYTGHMNAETNEVDVPTFNHVKFSYAEARTHKNVRFRDSNIPKNQLLSKITMSNSSDELWTYGLMYNGWGIWDHPMDPDVLGQIAYAPKGDPKNCLTKLSQEKDCVKPLTFQWDTFNPADYSSDTSDSSEKWWKDSPEYMLPSDSSGAGTQFVDLDGDGRLDFVQAIKGSTTNAVWHNKGNGNGWDKMDPLPSPAFLADDSGNTLPTLFMDIDGDGLPDLIAFDRVTAAQETRKVWLNKAKTNGGWVEQSGTPLKGDNMGVINLQSARGYINDQCGQVVHDGSLLVGDLDGDGRIELVNVEYIDSGVYSVHIVSTDGHEWYNNQHYFTPAGGKEGWVPHVFTLRDVNRDGLADLVTTDGKLIYLNGGYKQLANFDDIWTPVKYNGIERKYLIATGDIDGDGLYDEVFVKTKDYTKISECIYEQWPAGDDSTTVSLMSGTGMASENTTSYVDALNTHSFGPPWNPYLGNTQLGRYQLADLNGDGLADVIVNHLWGGAALINTNGTFRDVGNISKHPSWKLGCDPPSGSSRFEDDSPTGRGQNWIVTTALSPSKNVVINANPSTYPLDYFVDIDGDGIVDRIQSLMQCNKEKDSSCTAPYAKKTSLNKYHPPIIHEFPNGLANATKINYSVITNGDPRVYSDTAELEANTKYAAIPMRVVESMSTDNGIGSYLKNTYSYSSLRVSAKGYGSLGFKEVTVTDSMGYLTDTTYSQTYPKQGMPESVVRSKVGIGTVSKTITSYEDVGSQTRSIFIRPNKITDTSYLYASPSTPSSTPELADASTTTTSYTFDSYGNPELTTVTTTRGESETCATGGKGDAGASPGGVATSGICESYQKIIRNIYGSADSAERIRGKATETIVTSQELAPDPSGSNSFTSYTTDFVYSQDNQLRLLEKKFLPNSGVGKRLDAFYDYDRFGNLITTTSCASDFGNCKLNAKNDDHVDDPEHPPFRTTTVSYKPIDFTPGSNAPTATLAYTEEGRFPVKTTNAAGHVEYSAYDPKLGLLIQSTGPNGIHTCYTYDDLGWKTSETARCGSSAPLLTTMDRFRSGNSDSAWSKIVTVTRRPAKAPSADTSSPDATWVYTDSLGRTVETLGHILTGGFTETLTEYNSLGQTKQTSKPFASGPVPIIYVSIPSYDKFERVDKMTEILGKIDGTFVDQSTYVPRNEQTTIYNGYSTTTSTTVNGVTRTRTEKKNILGKVASVTDANGKTISYKYNADGNLTDSCYLQNNIDSCDRQSSNMQVYYDTAGRKRESIDPDLGQWTYMYNGFGDLISQTDGKNQTISMVYDVLGRMTSKTTKTDAAVTERWVYDVASVGGIGKLAAVIGAPDPNLNTPCTSPSIVPSTVPTDGNRAIRWLSYNALGELNESFECVDGETFSTQYDYDLAGRQSAIRYPAVQDSRFSVKYNYTSLGFLQYVSDAADDKVYWEAKSTSPAGQVVDEQTLNGVETISQRNPSAGWLLSQTVTAHADGENVIQDLKFKFDESGNLLKRMRSEPRDMADSTEIFEYDSLDRLTSSRVDVPLANGYDVSEVFHYDDGGLGNLTQKGGKSYSYTGCATGGGLHTVCSVDGGTPFSYDSNGNMTIGNNRTISYNGTNKVTQISRASATQENGSNVVRFAYGADGNRVVQSAGTIAAESTEFTEAARTVYVGLGGTGKSIYERTKKPSTGGAITTEHVHFIYAGGAHGGNAFALRVVTEDTSAASQTSSTASITFKYNHFDHLGSVTAMSDETGKVVGLASGGANATVMGYDAWGARRNPDGTTADPSSFPLQVGHREYTGHETIPSVGLVNMNGRVYDPELGRFLSPDPNIQSATDLQNYNRYSYVLNNPLRYTDPTGYAWYSFISSGHFWLNVGKFAAGVAACLNQATCYAYMAVMTSINTAVMIHNGYSWDQAIGIDMISVGVSLMGSEFGGSLGKAIGGGGMGAIVGGAASGTFTTVMNIPLSGTKNLGENLLAGAAIGAASAAAVYAMRGTNSVSQKSKDEQQGGGEPQSSSKFVPGRKVEGFFADLRDAYETYAKAGAACSAGPCSDSTYNLLDAAQTNVSVGVQAEVGLVLPQTISSSGGVGMLGLNLQLNLTDLSDSGLFLYFPGGEPSSGFLVSADAGFNLAVGHGTWSGLFNNVSAGAGPLTGSGFISPGWTGSGPGWTGLSLGLSVGPPSAATTQSYYLPVKP